MTLTPETQFESLPEDQRILFQDNVLAEARYRLTTPAQKVLGKLISLLNATQEEFSEICLSLDDVGPLLVNERNDVSFDHFCEISNELFGCRVFIPLPSLGGKPSRTLICGWVSSVAENPDDESITFSFEPKLSPYLLGLKRDYFVYPYLFICSFQSAYSIRLYQFLKAKGSSTRDHSISLIDCRNAMGAVEYDAKGRPLEKILVNYSDFKSVALVPAIMDINAKSDLTVEFREENEPGTEIVDRLVFSIQYKDSGSTML